jgi:ribosomal protein S18 acetylase RimI-like enzyme
MQIEPATPTDLPDIRAAYAHARATQREQGSSVWPEFTDTAILAEIATEALYRVVIDKSIVGVFSLAYEDSAIWGEHEIGAHMYLHRIARAAEYPGRGLVDVILEWADQQCARLKRSGLRMDTWASNRALIGFYLRRGFHLVEERRLGVDPRLPPHYHGDSFALLERSCERRR